LHITDSHQLDCSTLPFDAGLRVPRATHPGVATVGRPYDDDAIPRSPASTFRGSTRSSLDTRHSNIETGAAELGRDKVTTCGLCGAQFTGRYRQGNYSRHIRQLHSRTRAHSFLDCVCRVCKKEFNRQDARRKHEWKQHSLPDAEPTSRHRANTNASEAALPDRPPPVLAQAAGSEDSTRSSSQVYKSDPSFLDPSPDQPCFSESSNTSFTRHPQIAESQHHVHAAQRCTETEMPGWFVPPGSMLQVPLSSYPFLDNLNSNAQNLWTSPCNTLNQRDSSQLSQKMWAQFDDTDTLPGINGMFGALDTLGYLPTPAIYNSLDLISDENLPASDNGEFVGHIDISASEEDDDDDDKLRTMKKRPQPSVFEDRLQTSTSRPRR
jgi:hypothetical protein